MKRDFDLIRKLLISMEESGANTLEIPSVDGCSAEEIMYHLILLRDGGFVESESETSSTSNRVIKIHPPIMLLWKGQEFLDEIRDEKMWRKIVDEIRSKGCELTFAAIKCAVGILVKSQLGG